MAGGSGLIKPRCQMYDDAAKEIIRTPAGGCFASGKRSTTLNAGRHVPAAHLLYTNSKHSTRPNPAYKTPLPYCTQPTQPKGRETTRDQPRASPTAQHSSTTPASQRPHPSPEQNATMHLPRGLASSPSSPKTPYERPNPTSARPRSQATRQKAVPSMPRRRRQRSPSESYVIPDAMPRLRAGCGAVVLWWCGEGLGLLGQLLRSYRLSGYRVCVRG